VNLNNPDYGLISPHSIQRVAIVATCRIEGTRFWELAKIKVAVVLPALSRRGLLAGDSSHDELTNTNTIASPELMQTELNLFSIYFFPFIVALAARSMNRAKSPKYIFNL
jgi:hypothetical protein